MLQLIAVLLNCITWCRYEMQSKPFLGALGIFGGFLFVVVCFKWRGFAGPGWRQVCGGSLFMVGCCLGGEVALCEPWGRVRAGCCWWGWGCPCCLSSCPAQQWQTGTQTRQETGKMVLLVWFVFSPAPPEFLRYCPLWVFRRIHIHNLSSCRVAA